MNHIEQDTQKRPQKTGLFAVLGASLPSRGSSMPSTVARSRAYRPLALALFVTLPAVFALTVGVSPALATLGAPILRSVTAFPGSGTGPAIFSTRMSYSADLEDNGLPTEWRAEYSTSKSSLESGSGVIASSGTQAVSGEDSGPYIEFGSPSPLRFTGGGGRPVLRHLTPNTHYYARFVAKNGDGQAELPFEFTTQPVAAPEIGTNTDEPASEEPEVDHLERLDFGDVQGKNNIAPTSVTFWAKIESNGAPTEYTFGLSRSSPSGPFTTCVHNGSIATAEEFAEQEFHCEGLEPETTYYTRLIAHNEAGVMEQAKFYTGELGSRGEGNSIRTPTAKPLVGTPTFRNITAGSAQVEDGVQTNHEETRWRFEIASSVLGLVGMWAPVPGAAGTIPQAEAETESDQTVEGAIAGLEPATTYDVRLFAENASGEAQYCHEEEDAEVCELAATAAAAFGALETVGPPTALTLATHSFQGESPRVIGAVDPDNTPTSAEQTVTIGGAPTGGTFALTYRGQTTGAVGAGTVTSGSDTISALVAAEGTGNLVKGSGTVTGLTTGLGRFTVDDEVTGVGIPGSHDEIQAISGSTLTLSEPATATVSGAKLSTEGPQPFRVGEAISGTGIPPGTRITALEPSLTLSADATASGSGVALTADLPYDASPHTVERALGELPGEPSMAVQGANGGPYTIIFNGRDSEAEEPPIEGVASGLTPSGSIAIAVTNPGGVGYDTRYHFQYISQKAFEAEGGFAGPEVKETPEVDVGAGVESKFGAADLPGLTAGETYRYRIVAASTYPGPPVDGAEQTLTAPAAPAVESPVSCPNEAFRVGASARLPDCRAYEQLTPTHKEGAREPFNYGLAVGGGVVIAEGGDRVMLEAEGTNWGTSPAAGQGPYFFSREEGKGWRMTAASPQPQTGIDSTTSELFSPGLGSLGFSSSFETSQGNESKDVEYKVGPAGGPYVTAAAIPRGDAGSGSGWVAASRDFSRLFLASKDHALLGVATGTKEGSDLYEYAGGELRQVNVAGSSGATIGACGANIVKGDEEAGTESSAHAVSADGLRVFFEAVPGRDCSEPKHLYMREDGESTVDLGAYQFLGANAEGTEVLLEKRSGETHKILLDELESATLKALFAVHGGTSIGEGTFAVSEDFSTIYLISPESLIPLAQTAKSSLVDNIYRYDIPSGTLSLIDTGTRIRVEAAKVSADGHDLYLEADGLEGVPGGKGDQGSGGGSNSQVYRYDSEESVLQCMSCSSSFDPEPKLTAVFGDIGGNGGILRSLTGYPRQQFASANGDYAFFDTPSALLPSDVDGEVAPEAGLTPGESENTSTEFSVSSDVYEWRKPGIDGCTHVEGCLALITSGRGGFLNLFLGTDESGRDAFIYTNSQLVPGDEDTAGDVYDARIGGGMPPPAPRPVECEGDACSTPASAPNDETPSSFTFSGAGNALVPGPVDNPVVSSKKHKRKDRPKKGKPKGGKSKREKTKRRRAGGRRGRKASRRREMAIRSSEGVK